VDGYSGDAGNALMSTAADTWTANGRAFSALDNDNDDYVGGNCAANNGGWWFGQCSTSNVNIDATSIWVTGAAVWDVQATRMLVKSNREL